MRTTQNRRELIRAARQCFVWLVAISAFSCGTVAFAQTATKPPANSAKPPANSAKAPAKTTARTTRPATTPAQSDPFVGVWKLSADKSKYESGSAPRGFTRTYEDRGNGTIFMTTDVVGGQGAMTRSYLVYRRDGKPYPESAIGVESIRLVTVKPIDRHTEELAFMVGDTSVTSATTMRVSVSPDGRTMTQVMSGKTGQGRTFTNTLIFDKQ